MMTRTLLAAVGFAALASCGTVPNAAGLLFSIPNSCGDTPGASTNMICAGTDLVATVASKPPPRRTFDYTETDAFDLQLSSSMGEGLAKITVDNPAVTLPLEEIASQSLPAADSPRIVFWLAQIRNTGGEIKACEIQLESAIAGWLVKMGADYMKQRLTYGPADNYNATVYFDSQEDGAPIKQFIFTPRDGAALSCG